MRPYKTAILSLSVLLLLTISGSAVAISSLSKENKDIKNRMKEYADNYNAYQAQQDSILNGILEENADLKAKYDKVRASIAKASSAPVKPPVDPSNVTPMKPADKNLKDLHNDVYFIQMNSVEISFQGKVQSVPFGASGTGFLTNDGLFITARHVIEPWYYWGEDENDMIFINQIINEGAKVSGSFTALSPSGERFNFTTEQFTVDRSEDKKIQKNGIVLSSAWDSANDWAYLRPGKSGKLVLDKPLSSSLKQATELEILGYPFGFGHTANKVTPHYGTTTVSRDGLEDGFIFTTTRGFDQGNSGGPVFVNTAEGYKVVGIVSMGVGTAIGKLVPVSALK
jgi:S1-C subfamily serine protease